MTSRTVPLVSVNKTPARAAMLVASMVADLRPGFDISHIANSSTIAELPTILSSLVHKPEVLICSSQWTAEQQEEANSIAKEIIPNIRIVDIPPGLDAREGGYAIVRWLKQAVRDSGIPRAH